MSGPSFSQKIGELYTSLTNFASANNGLKKLYSVLSEHQQKFVELIMSSKGKVDATHADFTASAVDGINGKLRDVSRTSNVIAKETLRPPAAEEFIKMLEEERSQMVSKKASVPFDPSKGVDVQEKEIAAAGPKMVDGKEHAKLVSGRLKGWVSAKQIFGKSEDQKILGKIEKIIDDESYGAFQWNVYRRPTVFQCRDGTY